MLGISAVFKPEIYAAQKLLLLRYFSYYIIEKLHTRNALLKIGNDDTRVVLAFKQGNFFAKSLAMFRKEKVLKTTCASIP